MPLTVAERELLRNLVKNFIVKNPNDNKSKIVNHFVQTGFATSTIYNTLDKLSTTFGSKGKKNIQLEFWSGSRFPSEACQSPTFVFTSRRP